ncbi:MAG: exodeoxyribonuclease I [Methylococcaceae bacterium]
MATPSFFWHDYETFGIDTRRDRPVQFAGIRTDIKLNIIEEPVTCYCKPSLDYLPHPEACLLTGITPQIGVSKGVCETEFSANIHQHIARPGTCTVGYNNIRFDDEITRNLFYRNFLDPYAREWQQGNSRWDLIDLVRTAYALRPEPIQWPTKPDGSVSLRLEDLSAANDLEHHSAHDALSDVYATIALAKLIKQKLPKLFHFVFENRLKQKAHSLLQASNMQPILHVSGRYSSAQHCLAVVVVVGEHPTNKNEVIVFNLAEDPAPMLELTADEIKHRLFTAATDLPEGIHRIPLKTIHLNRCPVIAPLKTLRATDQDRLNIDISLCLENLEKIKQQPTLAKKLGQVFSPNYDETESDPDLMIYSGGFFNQHDKALFEQIRLSEPAKLAEIDFKFNDKRLSEMLFRYRARNFPETLTDQELAKWKQFCRKKIMETNNSEGKSLMAQHLDRINELKTKHQDEQGLNEIVASLEQYAGQVEQSIVG